MPSVAECTSLFTAKLYLFLKEEDNPLNAKVFYLHLGCSQSKLCKLFSLVQCEISSTGIKQLFSRKILSAR